MNIEIYKDGAVRVEYSLGGISIDIVIDSILQLPERLRSALVSLDKAGESVVVDGIGIRRSTKFSQNEKTLRCLEDSTQYLEDFIAGRYLLRDDLITKSIPPILDELEQLVLEYDRASAKIHDLDTSFLDSANMKDSEVNYTHKSIVWLARNYPKDCDIWTDIPEYVRGTPFNKKNMRVLYEWLAKHNYQAKHDFVTWFAKEFNKSPLDV